jgi:hypothetical protein
MPFEVQFDRDKANQLLDALRQGRAVAPPSDGWSRDDLLALAGSCFCLAMPRQLRVTGHTDKDGPHVDYEQKQVAYGDIHAAIEFCGQLVMHLLSGTYDRYFQPRCQAEVHGKGYRLMPKDATRQP